VIVRGRLVWLFVTSSAAFSSAGCSRACSSTSPDEPPPTASVGLVPAPPGALGARAASTPNDAGLMPFEPLDPHAEPEPLLAPEADASVPL
jgi:hypothetical protein